MKIGVLLPHVKIYGGVKRFLELGNVFEEQGHEFWIFTPALEAEVSWFKYKGKLSTFDCIDDHSLDVLFFTEPSFKEVVLKSNACRKIFYIVSKKVKLEELKGLGLDFYANSTDMLKKAEQAGLAAFSAIGGINTKLYTPLPVDKRSRDPFKILIYGRLSKKKKGSMLVVRACEVIYLFHKNIKIILFDSPTDEKASKAIKKFKTFVPFEFVVNHPPERNCELYARVNLYVNAEKGGGWANTTIESMASGTPVISTSQGTKDFLVHNHSGLVVRRNLFSVTRAIWKLIKNKELAETFSKNALAGIACYDWDYLGNKILSELYAKSKTEDNTSK